MALTKGITLRLIIFLVNNNFLLEDNYMVVGFVNAFVKTMIAMNVLRHIALTITFAITIIVIIVIKKNKPGILKIKF